MLITEEIYEGFQFFQEREKYMANLITQVDRTTGTYDNVFLYTINASFNGIQGEVESAAITMTIPNYFTVYLGDIEFPITSTDVDTQDDYTHYTFNFGSMSDLGVAVRIGFGLVYNYEADNGQTFTLETNMLINGETTLNYTAETIALSVTPRFQLSHEIVLPETNPAPGGQVYYKVELQNFGDLGGTITDVEISIEHPDSILLDESYIIVGEDVSTGTVTDDSQDGLEGDINGNTVTFSIPNYKGEIYHFIYRADISSTVLAGEEINTTAIWSHDGLYDLEDLDTFILASPSYQGYLEIYGPEWAISEGYICHQFYIANTGNQVLANTDLTLTLPQKTKYYNFDTGTFYISQIKEYLDISYYIDYTTFNGYSGTLGPFNTDTDSTVDLTSIIDSDDNLYTLNWNFDSFGIGLTHVSPPTLRSIALADLTSGGTILISGVLYWDNATGRGQSLDNHTTITQDICILNPVFSVSPSTPVRPGETLRFTMGASCLRSRLQDPIFAMIMPYQLDYSANVSVYKSDFFNVDEPVVAPEVSLEYDFNENGDTLVAFRFRDDYSYDFRQGNGVYLSFDATVKSDATGTISANMLLNTLSSVGKIPTGVTPYSDTDNIADDPSVDIDYASSSYSSNQILLFTSTSSNKKVKGSLDEEWLEEPLVGSTITGGNVEYEITLSNIGNSTIESISIVDILPHIDDTGVIEIDSPRESEYALYNISEVVAKVIDTDTGEVIEDVPIDYYYSLSYDPVRFGGNFDIIGSVDDWTQEVPSLLTDICSVKINFTDQNLLPGYSLVISMLTSTPVGTPTELVAWNSFAAEVSYTNSQGVSETLLAVEPEKVGVAVVDVPEGRGSIQGYTFYDANVNGYFDNTDHRVNDVGLILYDSLGYPIEYSTTTTSYEGLDGYYEFANLEPGEYYVGFFIETTEYKFTSQKLDADNGSKVNTSGVTQTLTVVADTVLDNINAGFIPIESYTLENILKVNRSARGMMRDVVKNQMLIGMKLEDTSQLIEDMLDK